MQSSINKWISQFPESQFLCKENRKDYINRVILGYELMSSSDVLICGIVRNAEKILPYTLARIERLGSFFKDYSVLLYENDSTDNTLKILQSAKLKNLVVKTEAKNTSFHEGTTSQDRLQDMAYYRNQYIKEIPKYKDVSYVIVLDCDLSGGWSYEGIANSISYNYYIVGSNSCIYRKRFGRHERLYYDSFAYRNIGVAEHRPEETNLMCLQRGEEPYAVDSCFGGLCIYRPICFHPTVKYEDWDCDHVTLHSQMRKIGYDVYINPSQITLYNFSRYVL